MRLLIFVLVAMAIPTVAIAQDAESRIVSEVTRFRTQAFRDSTPPTRDPQPIDRGRRLHVDSTSVGADSAFAYLTLRDQEHAHREVYTLVRREDRWFVIRCVVDRVLRLYGTGRAISSTIDGS